MRGVKLLGMAVTLVLYSMITGPHARVGFAQSDCAVLVQSGQSIQHAINNAAAGAVICLSPSTFKETIKIDKSLTLRGAGREDTTIKTEVSVLAVILIESDSDIEVKIMDLAITGFEQTNGIYVSGDGHATVTLSNLSISGNGSDGLSVNNFAQVNLVDSQISKNGADGVFLYEKTARVSIDNSQISDNLFWGLVVGGASQVSFINSVIASNRLGGLVMGDSANAQVQASIIKDNGIGYPCSQRDYSCNGIEIEGQAHLKMTNSTIKGSADWGIAALLRRCGYSSDYFIGQVIFQGTNKISDNNNMGKQDGKGNPGNHPFQNLLDGQVCLP
ncbi:right-handed parallel beta-helix repeat-containing protein [Candidatus Acetothermia bacterium]|nr:right-handed parallel beta-helix repeat-containing protein [Candidatus Acetothermia bacterium]MBI3460973.1 right-handed parallel beta-helix repeat-containing protein [Candidatus Acetothermia bacterium]MBI3660462.1 right-handed parallel beta-helix repeat-containing protein [Candidatus Acetothermia bacterium]